MTPSSKSGALAARSGGWDLLLIATLFAALWIALQLAMMLKV